LIRYQHLLSDGTLPQNDTLKHSTTAIITTTEEYPKIQARGRGCNPNEAKEYAQMIEAKMKENIIEPSNAPWCSNAILIRKDGKTRMVIDYRALNKITVKDSYPMPRIQDVTDALKETRWFTSIDCVQAFHQIPMGDERSKDLTTFKGPTGGLYRYRYMPMGLVNAMAIWSRFIDTAMEGMKDFVLCYADDVLIYTKHSNVEKHVEDLENVFKRLEQYGIKIKASKMKLGLTQMPFLGVSLQVRVKLKYRLEAKLRKNSEPFYGNEQPKILNTRRFWKRKFRKNLLANINTQCKSEHAQILN